MFSCSFPTVDQHCAGSYMSEYLSYDHIKPVIDEILILTDFFSGLDLDLKWNTGSPSRNLHWHPPYLSINDEDWWYAVQVRNELS